MTGGWCRPYLRRLYDAAAERGDLPAFGQMTADEYARQRAEYRASIKRPDSSETSESD